MPYYLFWSPWGTTVSRWEKEGFPAGVQHFRALFDVDQPPMEIPVNSGP